MIRRLSLSIRSGAELVAGDPEAIGGWSQGADLSGVLEPPSADGTAAARRALVTP